MEKVLVCILAQTRAHQVAWPSFKRRVLDALDADLALAVTLDDKYDYNNPYWQHAKYKWTSYQPGDIAETFDLAQRWLWDRDDESPPDWRKLLRIRGIWLGGIKEEDPQPSFSANLLYSRWLLLRGLQQDGILDRYDRFVVTRSDFVWMAPHPPLSVLDRDSIWIPDGEHWGGLNDRHIVVSRDDAVAALSLMDDILLRPDELYEEMKHVPVFRHWNLEQYLAHHLTRRGLMPRVRFFPYVMYTARPARDPWSRGGWSPNAIYYPSLGHVVKYEDELRRASTHAAVIRTREDWEKGEWKRLDATHAVDQYRPPTVDRLWFPVRKVVAGLRQPGRIARIKRYLQRRAATTTDRQ